MFVYHLVIVLSTNGNILLNTMIIGALSVFKNELFVFIVINKVLNIMNIFAVRRILLQGNF